ncbi:NAD(P)H-binding protein [Lentzea sp.]|uniref:NAD(P)H-binding protein n=1 Tax=Lentzea sp. TaxID=56099 RepID=UPI0039C922E4
MKVFLTGATDYIGSVIAEKSLRAGHDVVGLARSDASADKLGEQGAESVRGEISDTDRLADVVKGVDGVRTGGGHRFPVRGGSAGPRTASRRATRHVACSAGNRGTSTSSVRSVGHHADPGSTARRFRC